MKHFKKVIVIGLVCVTLLNSCTSTKYIHDSKSIKVQNEMRNSRIGRNAADIAVGTVFVIFAIILNAIFEDNDGMDFDDGEDEGNNRKFKKLRIKNKSQDSMYVNMLTNIAYDNISYSDILDIRLPGKKGMTVLVPYGADYNIYFRSENDSTEKLTKINTENQRRINLPAMDMSLFEIPYEGEEHKYE